MIRPMFFFEGETGGGGGGGTTLLGGAPAGESTPPAGGGEPAAPWHAGLPDIYRNEASLTSFTGFESKDLVPVPREFLEKVGGSYRETKALIGKKLEAPGENATPEQIASWRKTVGAPEKPEGYYPEGVKTLRPEVVPETMWDAESEKKFVELAHKHHLPPSAVKEIIGFHAESVKAALDASQGQETAILAEEGAKLRAAFGSEYDANLTLAKRMAQTVGLDPMSHPFFTTAEGVQVFAKMGKLLSEDKLVRGEGAGIDGSIAARISDITDMKSTSQIAREYRGEFGPERQSAAQKQLHELYAARDRK